MCWKVERIGWGARETELFYGEKWQMCFAKRRTRSGVLPVWGNSEVVTGIMRDEVLTETIWGFFFFFSGPLPAIFLVFPSNLFFQTLFFSLFCDENEEHEGFLWYI